MVLVDGEEINSSRLLREYREAKVKSFLLERLLLEELETFFADLENRPESYYDIFLNDSGKYIVVDDYSRREPLSKDILSQICRKYNVTFEGITKEVHTDYEGYESIQKVTYLFELIKNK